MVYGVSSVAQTKQYLEKRFSARLKRVKTKAFPIKDLAIGVGVLCRILYSIVSYLYVSCSRSIASVGEERANVSAIVYL